MKRVFGAALAVTALMWSGTASAALIYSTAGVVTLDETETWIPITSTFAGGPVISTPYKVKLTLKYSNPLTEGVLLIWPTITTIHNAGTPFEAIIVTDDIVFPFDPKAPANDIDGTFSLRPDAKGFSFTALSHPTRCQNVAYGADCSFSEVTGANLSFNQSPGDTVTYFLSISTVPEPAAWAMMIAGFGLVGGAMRRRSRTAQSDRGQASLPSRR